MPGLADDISSLHNATTTPRRQDEGGAAFEPQTGAKALPAACVVCANDDPGESEFQRCDGGCDRWFCIEGRCARDLGAMNYMPDMSGGDLVCGDCRSVQKKLKTSSASITTALQQQEFREQ